MRSRCGVSLLILLLPATLAAQSAPRPVAVTQSGDTTAVARDDASRQAAVCDGSEIRGFRLKRRVGDGIILSSFVLGVATGFSVKSKPSSGRGAAMGLAVGVPLFLLGGAVRELGYPSESFYERAVARMRTGETRSTDVRTCLSAPIATSSNGVTEEWTYFTSRPGITRNIKSLKFTFRDGVLAEIRHAQLDADAVAERLPSIPATVTPPPK